MHFPHLHLLHALLARSGGCNLLFLPGPLIFGKVSFFFFPIKKRATQSQNSENNRLQLDLFQVIETIYYHKGSNGH